MSALHDPTNAGIRRVFQYPAPAHSGNMSAATGANSAAVVSLAADTTGDRPHVVSEVWWSYSGSPTGGRLTVQDGSGTQRDFDITAGGPGFMPFNPPLSFAVGQAVTLTLAAGGAGVTGKVGCTAWRFN